MLTFDAQGKQLFEPIIYIFRRSKCISKIVKEETIQNTKEKVVRFIGASIE